MPTYFENFVKVMPAFTDHLCYHIDAEDAEDGDARVMQIVGNHRKQFLLGASGILTGFLTCGSLSPAVSRWSRARAGDVGSLELLYHFLDVSVLLEGGKMRWKNATKEV